jgi:RNA polymerase sigma-70 factor (ECF subfamily)
MLGRSKAGRFESRLRQHLPRLLGYAISLSGDDERARDLVQECAMRALAAKNVPDSDPAFRAWLFKIMRNLWIDLRRRPVESELDLEASQRIPDLSVSEARLVDAITVRRALAQLPPLAREILVLVDLSGFSYMEAAELLEVPVGTVMSRVSRARSALHMELQRSNVRPLRAKSGT